MRNARIMLIIAVMLMIVFSLSQAWADRGKEKHQKNHSKRVLKIEKAKYKRKKDRLVIKGKLKGYNLKALSITVRIKDPDTGVVIGSVKPDMKGRWRLIVKHPDYIPCSVVATAGELMAQSNVKNAPRDCSTQGDNQQGDEPQTGGSVKQPVTGVQYQVLAFNDLGMHCYDRDFSVFSILPPFNVIHAQVVKKGAEPEVLDDTEVEVYYSSVRDTRGSINTTSVGKTNFWDFVYELFGVFPSPDEGLTGNRMPGNRKTERIFAEYNPDKKWFTASGIPITSTDDSGSKNHYPMMRITAVDKATGQVLAYTDIVLPVSDEMHCGDCHSTGGMAANQSTAKRYSIGAWSDGGGDPEIEYRENILILHDAKHGTNLLSSTPVLCASCHYFPALDLAGKGPQGPQVGLPLLSEAIHGRHGRTMNGQMPSNPQDAIIPDTAGTGACYYCHPGSSTKCLRGVMAQSGIECQNCHGGMLQVAGEFSSRMPWVDEPKCQSCHTGDAVKNNGVIRETVAYDSSDPAALPRLNPWSRFAENNDTLYRDSLGHGGLACEACHGSTHAIWPSREANDNVAATEIQGHQGVIIECSVCHGNNLALTTDGPHGMHNVNDPQWNKEHGEFYEQNANTCKSCHGRNLEGTVLSMAHEQRTLFDKKGNRVSLSKGTVVSCSICHENPETGNISAPPTVPVQSPSQPTQSTQPSQPTTPTQPDGVALYSQNCSGCHGPLARSKKRGATASQIQNAINNNFGGMGRFKNLTTAEINAIASVL